jgi:hypothetical protein
MGLTLELWLAVAGLVLAVIGIIFNGLADDKLREILNRLKRRTPQEPDPT